ncbi:hypothetical protein GCM10011578_002120 [Streptomyces fuscichromogenes]|uniref:Uncharacterized protein n=1 Tax=Streptomyces fuscichromogenes TaxID=1324013 RepID=A0A917UE75_9ACTN|nr:hypothetical protein GCM10011578_002120 [Streptomyces fuscichromogenes]
MRLPLSCSAGARIRPRPEGRGTLRGNEVAINHEGSELTRTCQTSLPTGTYCNVQPNTT